jgi:hypothetical protein
MSMFAHNLVIKIKTGVQVFIFIKLAVKDQRDNASFKLTKYQAMVRKVQNAISLQILKLIPKKRIIKEQVNVQRVSKK